MKKILSIILCTIFFCCLCGCKKEAKNITVGDVESKVATEFNLAKQINQTVLDVEQIIKGQIPDPMKPVTDDSSENNTAYMPDDDKFYLTNILNFYVEFEDSITIDRQGFHILLEPESDTGGTLKLATDYWVFISKQEFEELKEKYNLDFTYEEYAKRRATEQENIVAVKIDPLTQEYDFDYTRSIEYIEKYTYTWNETTGILITTWPGAETIELFGSEEFDRIVDGQYATYTVNNSDTYPKKSNYQ